MKRITSQEAVPGTVAAYMSFIRHRLRFIALGTLATVLVMAVVTWSLPPLYSATAIIDTGALGESRGNDVDEFDNKMNSGGFRAALGTESYPSLKKVSLQFFRPYVFVRADATRAEEAQRAATAVAQRAAEGLAAIPPIRDDQPFVAVPSDDRIVAVRARMKDIGESLQEAIYSLQNEERDLERRADAVSSRLLVLLGERRWRLNDPEPTRLLEEACVRIPVARLDIQRRQHVFTGAADAVSGASTVGLTAADLAVLTPAARAFDASTAENVDRFRAALVGMLKAHAKEEAKRKARVVVRPVAITTLPDTPSRPAWPRPAVNLLVAFLFGLVGSSIASLLVTDRPTTIEERVSDAVAAGRR